MEIKAMGLARGTKPSKNTLHQIINLELSLHENNFIKETQQTRIAHITVET